MTVQAAPSPQRLSRELPAVGHGERGNDEPQRGGQYEVIGHERHPCTSRRWRNQRAGRETRVHEHRDEQAPSTVVDPHHQHPVRRQYTDREQERVQEEGPSGALPEGVPLPQTFTRKCHAPHRTPTMSPVVRTP